MRSAEREREARPRCDLLPGRVCARTTTLARDVTRSVAAYVRKTLQAIVSAAASDGRRQPNRTVRTRPARCNDRAARARARRAARAAQRLCAKRSMRRRSRSRSLRKVMRNNSPRRATNARRSKAELQEKDEVLASLGGGHEHTLRELNDALTVIKVLKAERDQLRKQLAQGGFRRAQRNRRRVRCSPLVTGDAGDGGGTINALIANAGWAEKKKPEPVPATRTPKSPRRTRRTRRCSRRTSCSRPRTRKRTTTSVSSGSTPRAPRPASRVRSTT